MREKFRKQLTELEIDGIVTAQANDDAAWEKPIRVHKAQPTSLSLPADLTARAAFLAQLHRTRSVEEWLTRIIQERVDLEEAAFIGVKRDLAANAA